MSSLAMTMTTRNKIHPHKFTLWIAIGSILMMFAGLTSAYIVKRNQANWESFELPLAFIYSTVAIVLSSVTIFLAGRAFQDRQMRRYRLLMLTTLILGLVFIALQVVGFRQLLGFGLGLQANVSVSFLYVIVGAHALHVAGGIIALAVMALRSFSRKVRNYSILPVQILGTYWHFVDILWIYLLVFLVMIR